MFAKIIGICATVFVLTQVTDIGKEQMKYITDSVKITLTQHEVNSIAHMINGFFCAGGERIPDQSPEEWSSYISKNMKSDLLSRNTSKDYWDSSYEVYETDTVPGLSGEGFVVRSKGPDTAAETEDDILSGYEYRD